MRVAMVAMVGVMVPSLAAAAPPELLNKSVTVSYTVAIPAKGADGSLVPGVRNTQRIFYISSAGRVFARVSRRDGRQLGTETKEAAPGEAANLRFEGAKLIGVMKLVSGAAQMVITFGQGGQSCDASIIMGRDTGKALRWKGVNGMTYEATGPATVSGVSCSIAAGNAFAAR